MILIYSFMGHSLRPDNLTITPDFVITDGTHNSGYVLVSATGGVASWKNTDNLPGFKTSHYVGELWAGGVVAAVWKENDVEKCLIASLCDYSEVYYSGVYDDYVVTSQYIWSNISATSSATSSYDGLANSGYILAQPLSSSGAALNCSNYINPDYGTGTFSNWYLPSVTEMQIVANNSFKINYAINKYAIDNSKLTYPWNGSNQYVSYITKYKPQNGPFFSFFKFANYYWTSTEVMNSDGLQAYSINILNNTPSRLNKNSGATVRPVRIASETKITTNFNLLVAEFSSTYSIVLTSNIFGSGDGIVEIGSCWNGPYSTSIGYGVEPDSLAIPLPTINDNKIVANMIYNPNIGIGYGNFSANFSSVIFNYSSIYSVRSYVITDKGVIKYGEQLIL